MPITVSNTRIPDVKIIEPKVFGDARGFFMESWNARDFEKLVQQEIQFVQDNHSKSMKGVVRGLHFQLPPHAQAKLVRCISGEIFDVAVDIRKNSPTFAQWVGVRLSSENHKQLWIPEGFAHGFVALSDHAEVFYKTNAFWAKEFEGSIRWDDPDIGIEWPLSDSPRLSDKDKAAPFLKDATIFNI